MDEKNLYSRFLDMSFLKFRRTLIYLSLHICPSHVLLPFFKDREKHTDVP